MPRSTASPHVRDRDAPTPTDVDPLTGATTRAALVDALRARAPAPLAIVAIELDHFRAVNESHGPQIGDRVLALAAARVRHVSPPRALVARTCGDEFAVVVDAALDATELARRIVNVLQRPYAIDGRVVELRAAAGVACMPRDGDSADPLLRSATIALREALRTPERVREFQREADEDRRERRELEADLRTALALQHAALHAALPIEQIEVYFQPQVTVGDDRLIGFEALARWHHPTRGIVGAADFVPLAEEVGLISTIGRWVLRSACRVAASWKLPPGSARPHVAVNVSPLQLREGAAFVRMVEEALAESGLPPAALELEITESVVMHQALDTLHAVRALGVALALDDFGTGFASLGQLAEYPFERLKIDRSFIRRCIVPQADCGAILDSTTQARRVVRAIAALGTSLGLATLAEGVEDPQVLELLAEAGVGEYQGYLISRPLPADRLPPMLARFAHDLPLERTQ